MQNPFNLRILRITTFLLFIGRAWEHIYWEGPFRNFFYNPHGFGKVLEWSTGSTLQDIYRDHFYEYLIDNISIGIGIIYALSGVAALFYSPSRRVLKWTICLGVFCLALTFYGFFVDKHYLYGTLLEYSAQFVTPIIFLWYCNGYGAGRALIVSKIAIAITFIYHGLFAIGYYPQPGNFTDMLIIGFGIQEDMARAALTNIAWMDFLFAGVVLIPFNILYRKEVLSKVLKVIFITLLSYAVFWGFMTSIARFYIHFDSQFIWQSFEGFFHEFLVRLPHGVFPMIILIEFLRKKNA
jgi:hypothetical protein